MDVLEVAEVLEVAVVLEAAVDDDLVPVALGDDLVPAVDVAEDDFVLDVVVAGVLELVLVDGEPRPL